MTNHTNCRHTASKRARAQCRQINVWLTQARELGLSVEQHHTQLEQIQQWSIRSQHTCLLITWGHTISIRRYSILVTSEAKTIPQNKLRFWIDAIASV
jgi:hypothetical protein